MCSFESSPQPRWSETVRTMSPVSRSVPIGELRLGKRCELRRKHLFAQWVFERYLDQ